ncbi:hypothetical protein AJ88_15360 [Mesorhizobium amorphae CCBAU 01583]|nr:hypothetical protein AJ88_15360 [Mesorhizobium amorphae CCBAU 01583]
MPEWLRNLAAIAEKSDAILIDRGDLSREVPIEQIPAVQKMIIRNAKAHGAKVYVATNLLESMTSAPTPTRAEVNDVYNTLADGADGLVLAAETAIGQYPVACARMVVKVAEQFRRNMAGGAHAIRVRPSSLHAGVEPHGGRLVIRTLGPAEDLEINDLPTVTVADEDLTDVGRSPAAPSRRCAASWTKGAWKAYLNTTGFPRDWPGRCRLCWLFPKKPQADFRMVTAFCLAAKADCCTPFSTSPKPTSSIRSCSRANGSARTRASIQVSPACLRAADISSPAASPSSSRCLRRTGATT